MMKYKTKKILLILLVMILAVSMTACGSSGGANPSVPPVNPDKGTEASGPDCTMLRQAMIETTDMAAVAYLGYYEGDYEGLVGYLEEYKLAEDHPFIKEIDADHFVELEGGELYCIVPADENAFVNVYEWIVSEENDYMGEVGNVVYESSNGEPFLLRGNVSEIAPNMFVEIVDSNGSTLEYNPSMSMMDGTLITPYEPPTILDFTPYLMFSDAFGYEYGFTLDELTAVADWSADVYTLNNEATGAAFYFDDYGNMELAYSVDEGYSYEVFYEGSFYPAEDGDLPEDTYILELDLVEDNSEYQIARPEIYSAVSFAKYPADNCIYMTYEAGDYVIDNASSYEYMLLPAVG